MEFRVVAVALGYDVVLFLLFFLVFLYFRRLRCDSLSKGARRRGGASPSARDAWARRDLIPRQEVEDSKTDRLWATLRVLHHTSDDEFVSLDVRFYLKFVRSLRRLFALASIVALGVALPANLTAPMRSRVNWTWIGRSSVENVTSEDWRIFLLMVLVLTYTSMAYWVVYTFWRDTKSFAEGVSGGEEDEVFRPEEFTVKLEGVDRHLTTAPAIVAQHFMSLFPEHFLCSRLIMDFKQHLRVLQKLQKTAAALRAFGRCQEISAPQVNSLSPLLATELTPQHLNEATVEDPYTAPTDPKNDNSAVNVATLATLREEWASTTEAMDALARVTPSKNVGIAFLSFRHTAAVQRCLDDPRVTGMWLNWSLAPAPRPGEIIWRNIGVSNFERSVRWFLCNTGILTASIILTSSAIATNALIPLSEVMENAVAEANFLRLSVTGWGAPLLLFVLNSVVLPLLVWAGANCVRFWLQSRLDMFVLDGNVVFLTLNTVIFPTIGNGSIGALIARFYHMELQQWNMSLGLLIASQSGSFALRYLLNACLITPGAALLQIGSMSYWGIMNSFGKTAEPFEFDFAYSYAFCIAICFMVLAAGCVLPIVMVMGCCFYTMKLLVDRYNLSCGVLRARKDSGGAVAAIGARYLVGSVGFMQFLLSGYFIAHGLSLVRATAKKQLLRGRALVLGGTCLLLVSALTVVLLAGHSLFVAPRSRTSGRRVRPDREPALKAAFAHPWESLVATTSSN